MEKSRDEPGACQNLHISMLTPPDLSAKDVKIFLGCFFFKHTNTVIYYYYVEILLLLLV